MTASELAKSAGLKSLSEAAKMLKIDRQNLNNWYHTKPALFNAIIIGCAEIKRRSYEDLQKKKELS